MTRSMRPVEWSERIYAAVVRAYPASFRRHYADELTLVFRELASDAWKRAGWLGLLGVWYRVLVDLVRTLPQQHYLEWQGTLQMKTVTPVKTTALVALSIVSTFWLDLALLAVLNAMLWVGWASGALTSYQHWPPSHLLAILALMLPPFATGFVARSAKPLYRPYWTAPLGTMMLPAAMSFADPRSPWLLSIVYPSLAGAATLLGCLVATRVLQRRVSRCPA